MKLFIGGLDPSGEPLPLTQDLLQELADSWATHSTVPTGVADQLTVSRRLFVRSFYVYEFATVAVAWSLFALEASLRVKLAAGTSASLKQLLDRALREGLVAQRFAQQLEAARACFEIHLAMPQPKPFGRTAWWRRLWRSATRWLQTSTCRAASTPDRPPSHWQAEDRRMT